MNEIKDEKSKMIEAFWHNDDEDDSQSGFMWDCPDCGALNDVGDDFVWNGKLGCHATKEGYMCEHCESDKEHRLWRR